MELRGETRATLEEGRRLFNAGRFFEAHEVWEAAWLREKGDIRTLLQGLIQIAAGYHQAFDRGHAKGCARLLGAGMARLEGLRDKRVGAGLALGTFREAVASSLAKARAWERGEAPAPSREEAPPLHAAEE